MVLQLGSEATPVCHQLAILAFLSDLLRANRFAAMTNTIKNYFKGAARAGAVARGVASTSIVSCLFPFHSGGQRHGDVVLLPCRSHVRIRQNGRKSVRCLPMLPLRALPGMQAKASANAGWHRGKAKPKSQRNAANAMQKREPTRTKEQVQATARPKQEATGQAKYCSNNKAPSTSGGSNKRWMLRAPPFSPPPPPPPISM